METDFRANNGSTSRKEVLNKRILFPINRNSDSTSQNERFIKNIRFHYAEKLLSPEEISKKLVQNSFQQGSSYSIKNDSTLF